MSNVGNGNLQLQVMHDAGSGPLRLHAVTVDQMGGWEVTEHY